MSDPIITVEGLRKSYGKRLVLEHFNGTIFTIR